MGIIRVYNYESKKNMYGGLSYSQKNTEAT